MTQQQQRGGRRRRIPPFPIHVVIDHPRVIALNAAALGMLWRLVTHYWVTDCVNFSDNPDVLFGLARAHRPTWAVHKGEILAIFADIAPDLSRNHATYRQRLANLAAMSIKGASAIGLRRLRLHGPRHVVDSATVTTPAIAQANRTPAPRVEPAPGGFVER